MFVTIQKDIDIREFSGADFIRLKSFRALFF